MLPAAFARAGTTEQKHGQASLQASFLNPRHLCRDDVKGNVFEAFVEQVLIPQLKPADVVIMNNRSSHKRARIRELIETREAELRYLPPYRAFPVFV